MKQVIKSEIVTDSKGVNHKFELVRVLGGYSFAWDDRDVDWSFTPNGYNQAVWHFNFICEDVLEINAMNSWVND